jgi:hypothetical protein
MTFDPETLARQLARLGQDLQDEVKALAVLEDICTELESAYRVRKNQLETATDRAFLSAEGSIDMRKATARLAVLAEQKQMEEAYLAWGKAKNAVSVQHASLRALNERVDIGRSLLSREKSLLALES